MLWCILMKELRETISNPVFEPESQYCRDFLRKKYFASIVLEQPSVNADVVASHLDSTLFYDIKTAERNYEAEETLEAAMCVYSGIAAEESKWSGSGTVNDFTSNLLRLQSSRAHSFASTSPNINELSKVWVSFIARSIWTSVDIDRVYRNLIFHLTIPDSVEDSLRIEPFGGIEEIQLRIPYVSDPMPKFNKIVSSPSAQKNISFDQAPKVVTLDFEEEE